MKKTVFVILIVVLLMSSIVSAQQTEAVRLREAAQANTFGSRPAESPFALLDLSRLHFSHSYSISFLSGGVGSGSVGLWNTSMFYELSPKLSLLMDLGVMHNGGVMSSPGDNSATFLPAFSMNYHPSDKFQLSIGVSRVNPYFSHNSFRSVGFGRNNLLLTGE